MSNPDTNDLLREFGDDVEGEAEQPELQEAPPGGESDDLLLSDPNDLLDRAARAHRGEPRAFGDEPTAEDRVSRQIAEQAALAEERTPIGQFAYSLRQMPASAIQGTVEPALRGIQVLGDELSARYGDAPDRDVEEGSLWRAADGVRNMVEGVFGSPDPVYEGTAATQISQALGNLAGYAGFGGISRGIGASVAGATTRRSAQRRADREARRQASNTDDIVNVASQAVRDSERTQRRVAQATQWGTIGGMALPAGIDESYQTATRWIAENPDAAAETGFTPDTARALALSGAPAGGIQVMSLVPILRRVPATMRPNAAAYLGRRMAEAGITEFTVENAGALVQNIIRQQYDEDHPLWDHIPERGTPAGIAASMLQAILFPMQRRAAQARGWRVHDDPDRQRSAHAIERDNDAFEALFGRELSEQLEMNPPDPNVEQYAALDEQASAEFNLAEMQQAERAGGVDVAMPVAETPDAPAAPDPGAVIDAPRPQDTAPMEVQVDDAAIEQGFVPPELSRQAAQMEVDPDLPPIQADPERRAQVFEQAAQQAESPQAQQDLQADAQYERQRARGETPRPRDNRQRARLDMTVQPERDDLLAAIAKLGGIHRDDATGFGVDPADFNRRGAGIHRVFSGDRARRPHTMDQMAEALHELGYEVQNEQGQYDANVLADQLHRALGGERIMTPRGYETVAEQQARDQAEQEQQMLDDMRAELSPIEAEILLDGQEPIFADNVYEPEAPIRARNLQDMFAEADEVDSARTERIAIQAEEQGWTPEETAQSLWEVIHAGRRDRDERVERMEEAPEAGLPEPAPFELEPTPAPAPPREPRREPETDDFIGRDRTAQQLHDSQAEVDADLTGRDRPAVEPGEGPGDLFTQRARQQQIEDVSTDPENATSVVADRIADDSGLTEGQVRHRQVTQSSFKVAERRGRAGDIANPVEGQTDVLTRSQRVSEDVAGQVRNQDMARGQYTGRVAHVSGQHSAAHIANAMRTEGQESAVAIVTDHAGRVMSVIRHTGQNLSQNPKQLAHMMAAVNSTPQAAHVYFAHNKPSGTGQLSQSDLALSETAMLMLDRSGIAFHGGLGIGANSQASMAYKGPNHDATREHRFTVPDLVRDHDPAPTRQKFSQAPREWKQTKMQTPEQLSDFLAQNYSDPGIAILDAKNRPVGFVPATLEQQARLGQYPDLRSRVQENARKHGGSWIVGYSPTGQQVTDTVRQASTTLDAQATEMGLFGAADVFVGQHSVHSQQDAFQRKPTIYFSLSRRRTPAQEVADRGHRHAIRRSIQNLRRRLPIHLPQIRVVDSAHSLPQSIRDQIYEMGPYARVEGVFDADANQIYLVADNLMSPEHARMKVLHELVGHYGFRRMMGDRLAPFLDRVWNSYQGTRTAQNLIDTYFAEGRFDANNRTHRHIVAEELIAHMAERQENPGLLGSIMAAIRQWLQNRGFNVGVTDSQILSMLNLAAHRALEEGTGAAITRRRESLQEIRFSIHQNGRQSQENKRRFMDRLAEGRPIDQAFETAFNYLGISRVTRKVGDAVGHVLQTWEPNPNTIAGQYFGSVLRTIRAGMISHYGLDQKFIQRDAAMRGDEAAIQAKSVELLTALQRADLTVHESRVLYDILTGQDVRNQRLNELAEPIRNAIIELGQEAVNLGLLDRATFERNKGIYLHRSYVKHEDQFDGFAKTIYRSFERRRKKIQGEEFMRRGLTYKRTFDQLRQAFTPEGRKKIGKPEDLVGKRFYILDRVQPDMIGDRTTREVTSSVPQTQKVVERIFVPEGQYREDQYHGYESRGRFEVLGKGKDGKIELWRDFTKSEREMMGEILDARYAIAKTFQILSHDLARGRFFRDISRNREWARAENEVDPETENVMPVQLRQAAKWHETFEEFDWVPVPDTVIPGTKNVKAWGDLAGMYVRPAVWRNINELDKMNRSGGWNSLMRSWKLMKTARSPVVHMNNIMSNFMLMDLVDVRFRDLKDALYSFMEKDDLYWQLHNLGGYESTFATEELRNSISKNVLENIRQQQREAGSETDAMLSTLSNLGYELFGKAKRADRWMTQAYQAEDEIFRLAIFMRRLSQGDDPATAAYQAKEQMLNYDIRAPWVNAARRTILPFISYTYRAVPVIARSLAHRPWKAAKYFTLTQAMNMMAYELAPGDEDEERRTMRSEEQGYTWVGTPRMLRMPWRDRNDNPVFLDIRRWIPAGDIFDLHQGQSVIPIIAPLQASGPLTMAFEAYLNMDQFTGDPVVQEDTATTADRYRETAKWLWRQWMPSAAWVPGSWHWNSMRDAMRGGRDILGRPMSVAQASASAFGVKLRPHDVDLAYHFRGLELQQRKRMLEAQMRQAQQDLDRNLISKRAYNRERDDVMRKMDMLEEEYARLLGED